jgi:5-methylcytosine-specific restriction endonuclease McrA
VACLDLALDFRPMINSLFPVAELADLWGVTPNTVSRRLSFLNIKPARHGNFRFLTQQEFHTACAFHRHIQSGQPMSAFVVRSNEVLNNKSHDTGYFLQNSRNSVSANNKKIPKGLRWSILERDGHKCQACGATNCLEIDHIIPRSKGGETIASNLQVLCADCNRGKGASMPSGQIKGIPLKDLEERWSLSRNGLKERAKILGVDLIRVSSNLTVWPEDKVELGDQLHAYVLTNKTSHGFYGKKNTSQFNLRLDSDLIAKFKACAYARGVVLGLDQGQSVNRAMHQAMQWYIDAMPE